MSVFVPSDIFHDFAHFLKSFIESPQNALHVVIPNRPISHVSSNFLDIPPTPDEYQAFHVAELFLKQLNLVVPSLPPPLQSAAIDFLNSLHKVPFILQNRRLHDATRILTLAEQT